MLDATIRRFWAKVRKSDGCWVWIGARHQVAGEATYGDFGKFGPAHRFSWILANGQIPPGLLILHKCDIKHCVNPRHLYLGTGKDNARDYKERGLHLPKNYVICPKREHHKRSTDNLSAKLREMKEEPLDRLARLAAWGTLLPWENYADDLNGSLSPDRGLADCDFS
jgi:HNH endonuclease